MKIVTRLLLIATQIITYAWMLAALIPLSIGIIMIDILLKLFKVEKVYLLMTDFTAWCSLISEHLKNTKNSNNKNNIGETTHYV